MTLEQAQHRYITKPVAYCIAAYVLLQVIKHIPIFGG